MHILLYTSTVLGSVLWLTFNIHVKGHIKVTEKLAYTRTWLEVCRGRLTFTDICCQNRESLRPLQTNNTGLHLTVVKRMNGVQQSCTNI